MQLRKKNTTLIELINYLAKKHAEKYTRENNPVNKQTSQSKSPNGKPFVFKFNKDRILKYTIWNKNINHVVLFIIVFCICFLIRGLLLRFGIDVNTMLLFLGYGH